MAPKRIAVIGAGAAGICALKTLREEGMEPVCYERTGHIGGLWRYHEGDEEGVASVMKSTIINSSKELSAFSDFPPKEDAPNYMHHSLVLEYLKDYANEFDVVKYVQFNKEVVSVDMAHDYDVTGRIDVTVKDTQTRELTKHAFDGAIVCVGHHVYPNMTTFRGEEEFRGKVMHTRSLKKVGEFEDQSVVVAGAGSSGMDAAVEISNVAKQVYLSTRRGAWILPRVGPWGLPVDVAVARRWIYLLGEYLPYSLMCWYCERSLNQRFDHATYNLKPQHRIWNQHPTTSDALPIKLLSGTVLVRKNIARFVENGVLFEGDHKVTECDVVVLATGYQIKFPFLSEKFTTIKDNEVRLYKYVFPPHLKHPSLVIGGLVQSSGAGFPVIESQLRWAVTVMNGKLDLPSEAVMVSDVQKKMNENGKWYIKSQRHTIQVNYINYMDEMTSLYGAKPNLWKMLFTDPELFVALLFGPSLPYQYRLQGPHAKPEMRKVILDCDRRVFRPLKTDYKNSPSVGCQHICIVLLCLLVSLIFVRF